MPERGGTNHTFGKSVEDAGGAGLGSDDGGIAICVMAISLHVLQLPDCVR